MKSTASFQDQLDTVGQLFSEWNDCERVVSLYSLLRRLGPTQVKFIYQIIGKMLPSVCSEIGPLEQQANDPAYIKSLLQESKGSAVTQLLRCLPLLFAGNTAAKAEYLHIIPIIIKHSISHQCDLEECRQLLCYAHLHPAISTDERALLSQWMSVLDELQTGNAQSRLIGQQAGLQTHPDIFSSGDLSEIFADSGYIGDTVHSVVSAQSSYTDEYASTRTEYANRMSTRDSGIADIDRRYSGAGMFGISSAARGGGRMPTSMSSLLLPDSGGGKAGKHPALTWTSSEPLGIAGPPARPGGSYGTSLGARNGHQKLMRTSAVNPTCLNSNTSSSAVQLHQSSITPSISPSTSMDRISPINPANQLTVSPVADWLSHLQPPFSMPAAGSTGIDQSGGVSKHLLTVSGGSQEHLPLSPQSSVTSSGSGGSESNMESRRGGSSRRGKSADSKGKESEDPEMRDIMIWLKALRLHKYSTLFQSISYDEMMSLTDEWLESQDVTKGARNKMLISIQKLHGRQEQLRKLEKEVLSGSVKNALSELRRIVYSPMKAFTTSPSIAASTTASSSSGDVPLQSDVTPTPSTESTPTDIPRDRLTVSFGMEPIGSAQDKGSASGKNEQESPSSLEGDSIAEGDLPGQITRIMGKICTQFLVTMRPEPECLNLYLHLLDRCIGHQAFHKEHKKKMQSWRPQIQRVLHFNLQKQQQHHQFDRHRIGFTVSPPGSSGSLPPPHTATHRPLRGAGPQLSSPAAAGGGSAAGHPTWTFMGRPQQNPIGSPVGLAQQVHLHPDAAAQQHQDSYAQHTADLLSPYIYANRPSSLEVNALKTPLGRTQSAPMRSDQQQFGLPLLHQQQPGAAGMSQERSSELIGLELFSMIAGLEQSETGGGAEGSATSTSPGGEESHLNQLKSLCMSMIEHAM